MCNKTDPNSKTVRKLQLGKEPLVVTMLPRLRLHRKCSSFPLSYPPLQSYCPPIILRYDLPEVVANATVDCHRQARYLAFEQAQPSASAIHQVTPPGGKKITDSDKLQQDIWIAKMSGSGRMQGLSCSASMTLKSVMHVTQERRFSVMRKRSLSCRIDYTDHLRNLSCWNGNCGTLIFRQPASQVTRPRHFYI